MGKKYPIPDSSDWMNQNDYIQKVFANDMMIPAKRIFSRPLTWDKPINPRCQNVIYI